MFITGEDDFGLL